MPLVVIVGRPCTGKTTVAEEVKRRFESLGVYEEVVLINEESLGKSKSTSYLSSNHEKEVRGALKSATEHALVRPNRLVILDALNYIKGYRYELYCATRNIRAPQCILWVSCTEAEARQRNSRLRLEGSDTYGEAELNELWMRFEAPNDANRWDHPLFKVQGSSTDYCQSVSESTMDATSATMPSIATTAPVTNPPPAPAIKSSWKPKKKSKVDEPVATAAESETTAFVISPEDLTPGAVLSISGSAVSYADDLSTFGDIDAVMGPMKDYLLNAVVPPPNSSTISTQRAQADLLYELDRTSQRITQMIMVHQADALEGTPLMFPDYDRALTLNRHVSLAELQRYRGQFVKVNAQHPPSSAIAVEIREH